jgi:DNA polymerase V
VYGQQAAARLVKHRQKVKLLTVFAGTSHFAAQRGFPSVPVPLPPPTSDPVVLAKAAQRILPLLHEGTRYARAVISPV